MVVILIVVAILLIIVAILMVMILVNVGHKNRNNRVPIYTIRGSGSLAV